MLERIMDLHLLLYTMTALGALGAVGMLDLQKSHAKNKSSDEPEGKMAEPLEDQGQASQQDESSCVGTVASFSGVPGTGSFFSYQAGT